MRFNEAAALQPRKTIRPEERTVVATPPSFNEAAALQPRKTHPCTLDRIRLADVWTASMRPRHYSRGKLGRLSSARARSTKSRASMRPRHYSRGKPRMRGCRRRKPLHPRFNEAAALQPRKTPSPAAMILTRRYKRFNEAAALQPRKTVALRTGAPALREASMEGQGRKPRKTARPVHPE